MTSRSSVCILVPTYNEAENIRFFLGGLFLALPAARVIVIDDGSPDGTGDIVRGLMASDDRLRLISRDGKQGLGTAYRVGMAAAIEEGHDLVIEMDADMSHPSDRLQELVRMAESADLVIGSRYVAGGRTSGWTWRRETLSRVANVLAMVVLGTRVRDLTAGFRCYRATALRAIDLPTVHSNGYAFQVEMTHRILRAGLSVTEIPITFTERRAGTSKMSGRIVLEAVRLLAAIAWERWSPMSDYGTYRSQRPIG
jgi:dolichol-phosphate mannosyltransferase